MTDPVSYWKRFKQKPRAFFTFVAAMVALILLMAVTPAVFASSRSSVGTRVAKHRTSGIAESEATGTTPDSDPAATASAADATATAASGAATNADATATAASSTATAADATAVAFNGAATATAASNATATATANSTATAVASATVAASATAAAEITPTPAVSPTLATTATLSPTASATTAPVATETSVASPTPATSPTTAATPVPSATTEPPATETATASPVASPSVTVSPTEGASPIASPTSETTATATPAPLPPDLSVKVISVSDPVAVGSDAVLRVVVKNSAHAGPVDASAPIMVTFMPPVGLARVRVEDEETWTQATPKQTDGGDLRAWNASVDRNTGLVTLIYSGEYPVKPGDTLPSILIVGTPTLKAVPRIMVYAAVLTPADSDMSNNVGSAVINVRFRFPQPIPVHPD